MILVTVGTEQYPFNRLMHWIDLLLRQGLISDEVVVQSGNCGVIPGGAKVYQFLKEEKFRELVQQADLIIAHCGEGTVLLLDSLEKPYILVPRTFAFKEHVDNHQVEMAVALEEVDVPVAWGPGDLVRFLQTPRRTSVTDLSETTAAALCQSLCERFWATQKLHSSPSNSVPLP
ncbi:MAG: glucosyl transferase [Acaryochloridaceae cyanobacterium RU_4_10]|nr:glucosyl transferase [Acaryochloridaceae cyanobacterium RU_4_10]